LALENSSDPNPVPELDEELAPKSPAVLGEENLGLDRGKEDARGGGGEIGVGGASKGITPGSPGT